MTPRGTTSGTSSDRSCDGTTPAEANVLASREAWTTCGVVCVAFAALSTWANLTAEGFLEADAAAHYLLARHAFTDPAYFTDVWGRPVATALYAPGAWVAGVTGARLTGLGVALLLAWLVAGVARRQGASPTLAAIFTLGQPLVFFHSFAELTELPFATLLMASLAAYQTKRWALLAILAGLLPATRPEGLAFFALAAAGVVWHRRATHLPLLILPILVWEAAGWHLNGRTVPLGTWLVSRWPYSNASAYDPGPFGHFVRLLPAVVGPIVFPAVVVGLGVLIVRLRRGGDGRGTHRRTCDGLLIVIPLGVIGVHSVLYALGRLASSGEARYLLTVSPVLAIWAAVGWQWAAGRYRLDVPTPFAAAAVLGAIGLHAAYPILPLVAGDDWRAAGDVAVWYETKGRHAYPRLVASHPGVAVALDVPPPDASANTMRTAAPDTLWAYDPIYGRYNADAGRSITPDLLASHGWREIPAPIGLPPGWVIMAKAR